MYCPCCAGRNVPSIHLPHRGGSFDGDSRHMAPKQFGIHRTSEPRKPCIPGDLLDVPLPVITDLVITPIVSYCNVLIIHSSRQNSFATAYLIGYTTLGSNDTRLGSPKRSVRRTSTTRKRQRAVTPLLCGGGSVQPSSSEFSGRTSSYLSRNS